MTRSKYMQSVMLATYWQVPMISLTQGTIEGSWEKAIGEHIQEDAKDGHSEAEVIMQSVGGDPLKAGYLVTSSKIVEYGQACI